MSERDARMWLDLVRTQAAEVLGCPRDAVPPERPFAELGLDSVTALDLAERLGAEAGLPLPGTLAFDYPTPAALADYLVGKLAHTPQPVPLARDDAGPPTLEPIAIVAMACRFPGGISSPEEFWTLLTRGRDAIGPFPTDRHWDSAIVDPDADRPGTSYVRHGGFIERVADFDAGFFGLSPREARATDPQQRLMLEISWEALERAGIEPRTLRGSRTGVFTGVIAGDYAPRLGEIPPELAGFILAGNAPSVVSGRVSYTLGLEGPSLSVDTACSSSLVALHLAVRALRAGECTLALAGGVTVIATPLVFTEFSRQAGLAPDGRCKAFSAAADGTGWAEGAGVLVLERLGDARRHGHPVLAVVRGSAVNSDGASNGLTAPNGPAQQRLIGQALADAELTPADVDAVEAHGTGTRLGDPIEAQALLATYGQDRDRPLWLGSVKSNIGHTQAAAGVAGVMKMVLALTHGRLPRTLHADEPSPFVDWNSGAVCLLTEEKDWPDDGNTRRAAVSSFGISGTNAHVIIEQAATTQTVEPETTAPETAGLGGASAPLLLSARTEPALRAQAHRWHEYLSAHPYLDRADVAAAAAARTAFEHRAVVFDHSVLAGLARGDAAPDVMTGRAGEGGVAFVFSGQGSQRPGMGHRLAADAPVFAAALEEVCTELDRHLDRPIRQVINGEPELLDQTGYTQPALFALEVALYRQVRAWGLRPDFVLGHSIGELAAAYAAGALALPEACRLVAARARLMQALPAGGAMIAIQAMPDEVEPVLAQCPDEVSLAAVNGPRSVVVAGTLAAVTAVADMFAARGRKTSRLRVSHAFHSPLMRPMLADFDAVQADLPKQVARIPLVSNVTATAMTEIEPGYWTRHARQPVRFADSVHWLHQQGVRRFLELGPGGIATAMVLDCLPAGEDLAAVPLLREGLPEPDSALRALARLHVDGVDVDWHAVLRPHPPAVKPQLPTYPFQRQRYWLSRAGRPLLGDPVELPGEKDAGADRLVFSGELGLADQPWLGEHRIAGIALAPATLLVELALCAGAEAGFPSLGELLIQAPLALPEQGMVQLRLLVTEPIDDRRPFDIYARTEGGPWTHQASGTLTGAERSAAKRLKVWPPPGAAPLPVDGLYRDLALRGYGYGPAFQGLRRAWQRGDEIFAEVALPEQVSADSGQFRLHPALLDAALHAVSLAAESDSGLLVPYAWSGVDLYSPGASEVRVRLTRRGTELSVDFADVTGAPVATVRGLSLRPISGDQLPAGGTDLYELRWQRAPETPAFSGTLGHFDELDDQVPDVVLATLTPAGLPASGTDRLHAVVGHALALVHRWLADARFTNSRLVLLSRGGASGHTTDAALAAAWGLVGSAQSEHPDRFILVDLDDDPASHAALNSALGTGEPQLAIRAGEPLVPRLALATPAEPAVVPWDPEGTVLITGGTGALGRLLARHLVVHHGIRHLLLAGRRGPRAPEIDMFARQLREAGAVSLTVTACDVGDREELRALLASVPAQHPLTGVFHLAGMLDDGVIEAQTRERVDAVLHAKADAAWHLHELTLDQPLATFVLFSSAAGLLGSPGQAGYAAANASLDALARYRRAAGLPAHAVAWGLWELPGGMADQVSRAGQRRLRAIGLVPLTAERGLRLLDQALYGTDPTPVAAVVDPTALAMTAGTELPPPLRGLLPASGRPASPAASAPPDLRQRLPTLSPEEQERTLRELVLGEVARVLGHGSPAELDAGRALPELGFDSLTAVELRNRLSAVTGLRLPATLVFDHPHVRALVTYLRAELVPEQVATPVAVLEELTQIESALAHLTLDAVGRERLAGSLSRMLAVVEGGRDTADAAGDDFFDLVP